MITANAEAKLTEKHNEIWGWVMKRGAEIRDKCPVEAGLFPDKPFDQAWDLAVLEFGIGGATGREVSEFIYKLNAQHARTVKAKQTRVVDRALSKIPKGKRSELQILQAEQKAIEKKIKELKEQRFKGTFFRVMNFGHEGYIFQVQKINNPRSFTNLIKLTQKEANELAKKLEELWPQ